MTRIINPVIVLALVSAAFVVQGANRVHNAMQFLAAQETGEMVSDLVQRGSHSFVWAAVFAVLAGIAGYTVRLRRQASVVVA